MNKTCNAKLKTLTTSTAIVLRRWRYCGLSWVNKCDRTGHCALSTTIYYIRRESPLCLFEYLISSTKTSRMFIVAYPTPASMSLNLFKNAVANVRPVLELDEHTSDYTISGNGTFRHYRK